jgi:hypothetical protein
MQERLQERQREMQIREAEDERIRNLQERIRETNNSDISSDARFMIVSGLTDRIQQIYERRAEREVLAAEREMMRQQAIIEETTQKQEVPEQNYDDPEEAEEARERSNIRGMIMFAASQDTINTLRQTRATLSEEAGHIRRAIKHENSNYIKVGSDTRDVIVSAQSGTGNPNDFRNQHLSRLNRGIAGTTAAINIAVAAAYRENSRPQESQASEYSEQPGQPEQEEEYEI